MTNEGRLKIGTNFLKIGTDYLRIGPVSAEPDAGDPSSQWSSITGHLQANNKRAYLMMISRDNATPSISWSDAYVEELESFSVTYGRDDPPFSSEVVKNFKLYLVVPTGSGSTATFVAVGSIDEAGGFVCNYAITDPAAQITVTVTHNQAEDVITTNGLHELSASASGSTAASNREAQIAWLGAYSYWTGSGGTSAEWNGDTEPPTLLSSGGLFPSQEIGPSTNNTGEVAKSETWAIFGPLDTYYSYATATVAHMTLNETP